MGIPRIAGDFSMAAVWAGLTTFVWYGFGALPLHLEVASQLGLNTTESSSWIFIIWFSGAISSIALTLYYRLPMPNTPSSRIAAPAMRLAPTRSAKLNWPARVPR